MLAAACHRRVPAREPDARLTEESLARTTSAEIVVGPINQSTSSDGKALFVDGTIRNVGTRPTRDLRVAVHGLDAAGAVLATADALPTPQVVEPGTTATYVVRLPNDPAIRTFHVEAIGR